MIKHYMVSENKTACGILMAGKARRLLAADNVLDVSCEQCISKERQAHFKLKSLAEKGMSWQEARSLALYWSE